MLRQRALPNKNSNIFVQWFQAFVQSICPLCLCFIFALSGACKLTNQLHAGLSSASKELFDKHATKIWQSILDEVFGVSIHPFKLNSGYFRRSVGLAECLCAVLLLYGGWARRTASYALAFIMVCAAYTHTLIEPPEDQVVPFLIAFLCLLVAVTTESKAMPSS